MSTAEVTFGIVGLDGHGPVFAEAINGPERQVAGARVTAAVAVPSVMISSEALARNVEQTRALGVEIVEAPEDLAARADAILVLHDDGARHLDLTRRVAALGKPLFVDKPLEATAAKARELIDVCRAHACPVFTASSLRFSPEIREVRDNDADGRVISAMTYSPFTMKPTMPGWIYYGVHAVEPLYALMGAGCREVRCVRAGPAAAAIGVWADGRIGIARVATDGERGYGFTVWRDKAVRVSAVDTDGIYPALLDRVKTFAGTGRPPVDADESVEVIAFMEAANESMARGGDSVGLGSSQG